MLEYICLPNSLSEKITSAKTFGMNKDNIFDHLPVQLAVSYTDSFASSYIANQQSSTPKPKVHSGPNLQRMRYIAHPLNELVNIE